MTDTASWPIRDTTSAVLTIETDAGVSGSVVTRVADGNEAILDRFVRPNVIGEDPLCTEMLWYKIYKWQRLGGGLLTDRVLATVDLALWDLEGEGC